jgi:ADP-ribosyl-[dinitrogen reductase] hydrolase
MSRITSEASPIRVGYLAAGAICISGRIGMTLAPGKKGPEQGCVWDRDLAQDLWRLRSTYKTSVLVSLIEESERVELAIPHLPQAAREAELDLMAFPFPDGGVPRSLEQLASLVVKILDEAANGRNVVIHCKGGLGRTGLVAACCLVARGHSPEAAIGLVRRARADAVEPGRQERFIRDFAEHWPQRADRRWLLPSSSARDRFTPRFERVRGCLLAGALGDALGYPVEFTRSGSEVIRRHGAEPPRDLAYAGKVPAEISDDTQMTLFAAEGIIRAIQRSNDRGICHMPLMILFALIRWYGTQMKSKLPDTVEELARASWLLDEPGLRHNRAPGRTNMSALAAQAKHLDLPDVGRPPNNSKGCGAIMRSAPIGLAAADRETAFTVARDSGVTTHGHPGGYLSAAYSAALMHDVARDVPLEQAMRNAESLLCGDRGHEETLEAVRAAQKLAARGVPDAAALESLGGGCVGEQTLAIALACVLSARGRDHKEFSRVLWRSVAHGGDSDSTGSVTGNLLGAMYGAEVLPRRWLRQLELRSLIERIADDLFASAIVGVDLDHEAYPPN